ncbi:MAG: hypothetical protein PHR28_13685 [candidate division Zixibacteria bacterium]|nr:hypothetical protein [candidate division Zixibacteria bacterium]
MRCLSWIAILPVMFLAVGIVSAQNPHDVADLRAALEKTDEVIMQARDAVAESGSERAKNLLATSEKLQERARSLANAAITDHNTPLALRAAKMTVKARLQAERAIAVTRQAEENEDYVRRRLEVTDDMIRTVQEKLTAEIRPQIRLIFDSAREKQQRALEFLQSRRLKMALQMTLQAQKSLEKLLQGTELQEKAKQDYETLLERYLSLSDWAAAYDSRGGADTENRRRQAERQRTEAENLADDGQYMRAERTLRKAVDILAELQQKEREPQKIAATLDELNEWAERLRPQVDQSSDGKVKRLYETARDHLDRGAVLSREGNYEQAARRLQAARQTLSEISNLLGQ